ncbi:MAG TPA: hypothetical protein VKU85_09725, partial [bacterium]|nr:hypothetical protein [bacterium]
SPAVPEAVRVSAVRHFGRGRDRSDLVYSRGVLQDDHSLGLSSELPGVWAIAPDARSARGDGLLPRFVAFVGEKGELIVAVACWESPAPRLVPDIAELTRAFDWRGPERWGWDLRFIPEDTRLALREVASALDEAPWVPHPDSPEGAIVLRPRWVDTLGPDEPGVRWITQVIDPGSWSTSIAHPGDNPGLRFDDPIELSLESPGLGGHSHLGYLGD